MLNTKLAKTPLAVIVISQLFGTSLWFSVNGVGPALVNAVDLSDTDLGLLTMAVQAGFVAGTLLIAITGLADRVRASRLFAIAAIAGAAINAGFILVAGDPYAGALARFLTGLCLAGIYPLGMKLVVSWTPRYAGAALGWLVGMLTLGTALPHLLRGATFNLPWQWPLLLASGLALIAALLIYTLGDGPQLPGPTNSSRPWAGLAAFRHINFRASTFAYFGHCWELYAFWTLTPFMVSREIARLGVHAAWLPWLAFFVIALGLPGCVLGGRISRRFGSFNVARVALAISGTLCLFYPLLGDASPIILLALLALWGMAVIADSPQFSALASATAPRERLGAALAVMNAIGFAVTIPAIALTTHFWAQQQLHVIWWLLPGPVLGLLALHRMNRHTLREI
ncbi:MFS transporter [Chromohalobacter nigrandesensis]|uniref:MFS transporter n=1 Tax=Chromohalobacter nigrandesensis TaxID=119863 RepID=UPI001FF386D4|nr:MFS transporter [Chromohalobacter nigrandesensis]MCK0746086.1 MFS transporter [Chromohalobacter nigrandesensis]